MNKKKWFFCFNFLFKQKSLIGFKVNWWIEFVCQIYWKSTSSLNLKLEMECKRFCKQGFNEYEIWYEILSYLLNCCLQPFSEDYNSALEHHSSQLCYFYSTVLHRLPYARFSRSFSWQFLFNLMVFSFLPKKKCALYFKKNTILCLFLKNVSPSKRVVCFILNNLHFPMVEGIAFYALYKSINNFWLPDEI